MKKGCLYGILLALLISAEGYGQQVLFRNFSFPEGLNTYNIFKTVQDKYGFIWVATQDGIYRFDGKVFTGLKNNTPEPFPFQGNFFMDISPGHENDIYAADFNAGIEVMDASNLSLKTIPANLPNFWLENIYVDSHSNIWVGGKDFLAFRSKQDSLFKVITKIDGYDGALDIVFIKPVSANQTAIGIWGYGFLVYNSETLQLEHSVRTVSPVNSELNEEIKDIFHDSDATFGVTNKGIIKFDLDGRDRLYKRIYSNEIFNTLTVNCFVKDKNNSFWIGTNSGLLNVNLNSTKTLLYVASFSKKRWLQDNSINHLMIDNQNNLWISTSKSLQMVNLNGNYFHYFSGDEPGSDHMSHVYTLAPKNDNEIFATATDGLYITNITTGVTNKIHGSSALGLVHHIEQIEPDFWIISCELGMYGFKPSENLISQDLLLFKYPEWKKYKSNFFNNAFRKGSLLYWASEEQEGLLKWNKVENTIQQFKAGAENSRGVPENHIHNLKADRDGNLWLLGDNSVVKFDVERDSVIEVIKYAKNKVGFNASIYFDLFDDGNTLWFGTYGGGLNGYNRKNKTWQYITENDGLCNNSVYGILPEKDSIIWVSTNKGLSRVNHYTKTCTNYYYDDGLQDNSFDEKGALAIGKKLFFGGINGFTEIDPQKAEYLQYKPQIYIHKLEYYNKNKKYILNRLTWDKLVLPPGTNLIAVHLSILSFANNHKLRFSYKIDGIQNEYIDVEENNTITLNTLSFGEYKLIIGYHKEDGSFIENILNLQIIISPKWYETLWFKALAILLLVPVIYAMYRYRINQIRKQEQIRTQIASDLHDDIGSTLNSIKVFSNLALMKPEKPEYLMHIKEGTQDAITSLRDIMWVLDDKLDTVSDVISRFEHFALPLAEANEIELVKNIDPALTYYILNKDEKRNLYHMMKEAFNNCMKYAACRQFSYAIKLVKAKKIAIQIKDDGRGFEVTASTAGSGLKNMRDRAEQIGYKFSIHSSSGKGTIIDLYQN